MTTEETTAHTQNNNEKEDKTHSCNNMKNTHRGRNDEREREREIDRSASS